MNRISIYVIIAVIVAVIGYFAFERSNASKLTGTQSSLHPDIEQPLKLA